MEITIRNATDNDLEECLAIEKTALAGHCYLEEVWDNFKLSKGEFKCAIANGKIVGFGKFTVLYDGSGWLEALRVDPKYQDKGIGSAIYNDYLKQAKEFSCPSMAMGTNPLNIASSHLAEKFGLQTTGLVRKYFTNNFDCDPKKIDFTPVSCNRAVELIMPDKDKYNGYIVMSGTCFPFNEETIRGFASDGKIFEDKTSGSYIICGTRFLYNEAIYIGLAGGDYKKCFDFARCLAKVQGVGNVNCSFIVDNSEFQQALEENGFEKIAYEWIVKEVVF